MSLAYLRWWFPNDAHHYPAYFEEIAQRIPAAGRILDLGCGANYQLARFRTPALEVWGSDLQRHPRLDHADWFRLMPPDGTIPFPDDSFDLIATHMVVEHVADPSAFLREVARVLRPGGYFVALTISSLHYVTWIRRLLGLVPHAWTQRLVYRLYGRREDDTFPTYYRMNRPGRIDRHARPAGLERVFLQRYACPGYFEFSRPIWYTSIIADWLLDHLTPGLGRIYFTVIYRKAAAGAIPPLRAAG